MINANFHGSKNSGQLPVFEKYCAARHNYSLLFAERVIEFRCCSAVRQLEYLYPRMKARSISGALAQRFIAGARVSPASKRRVVRVATARVYRRGVEENDSGWRVL